MNQSTAVNEAMLLEISHFSFLATSSWFLWDWVIAIDLEIEHFWGKPLNTGSILYLANRLFGMIGIVLHAIETMVLNGATSQEMCKPVIFTFLVISTLNGFVMQTVLVLRTYALWDCNGQIYWSLMGLNVAASLAQQLLNGAIWLPGEFPVYPNPLPGPYGGCASQGMYSKGIWSRYVPILTFELRFIDFIAIAVSSILCVMANASKWGKAHDTYLIAFDVTTTVSSICCARLLLNIRDVMSLSDLSDPLGWQPRWTIVEAGLPPSDNKQHESRMHDPTSRTHTLAEPERSQIEAFDDLLGE
ncbi:hypothetical protein DL93DRAFT_1462589 [Clavulina sp. PMI_390]|nr:hypothetical protein DL93DRAFT_1462589 [Clavulina sp. PMI_390]